MDHALGIVWAWDPFLKGIVFVLTAIAILVGSVYLVLSTDLGGRLGFLVTGAALFGWIFIMSVVWTSYGIGYKGRPPTWKTKQTVAGDLGRSANRILADYPERWHKLDAGSPEVADAQATADSVLAGDSGQPFKATSAYKTSVAYEKGGQKHFFTLLHKPHFLILQVQPVVASTTSTPSTKLDTSKPPVSVIMERDLGSLRQPALVIALFSGGLFFVFCYALHLRDKAIIALKAAPAGT